MTISVIIATRDRAALLASTLDALSQQHALRDDLEVLIVDNGSRDNTAEVVEAAGRRGLPVHYLYEPKPGKSHALNTAIARAKGQLLVFTDDDVVPSQGWLAAYACAFAETGADYAAGRIFPLWEAPPPRWLSPALYGVLAIPDAGAERVTILKGQNEHIMPLGANMAVRRHVLDRVHGWDPTLGKLQGTLRTGEDHEFSLRMIAAGFRGVYEPSASVQHRVPADRLRLRYFLRWYYDNGGIEASLEDDYPTTQHYLLRVPRYLWRQLVTHLFGAAMGIVTLSAERSGRHLMRVVWFAGYVWERWTGERRSVGGVHALPATLPRS